MYKKQDIIDEYNISSELDEEFKKVKWGSKSSMINRFNLTLTELPFSNDIVWLDIGCGTGAFQRVVKDIYPEIKGLGIDLNKKLLSYAKQKKIDGISFDVCDFMNLTNKKFQLITCLGVVQKANFTLSQFFKHVSDLLLPGGWLFVDTKYIGWERFKEPGIVPESIHQWFDLKQIREALQESSLIEKKLSGFLPDENKIVDPKLSHTVYLVARNIASK